MANVAAAQDADEQRRLADLNGELAILIELFPYVLPEVFREMLMRFDGRSRLEMVVNNLLSGKDTWIKGRLRPAAEPADFSSFADGSKIPTIDLFRRNSYKWAVKANLLHEFKSLSKSTVMAVLAEKNYCYTLARPVLQDITSKSWRYSIKRFFSRWSKSTDNVSEKHGMIQWIELSDGAPMPMLKETGDAELDQELHQTMLAPLLARYRAQQEASDREIAETINEEEATTADALFECGCCFGSSTFEQVASCTESAHIICFECISRAVSEALYGQCWGQTVDHDRGSIRCLVPMAKENCPGIIPYEMTQRAVYHSQKGPRMWPRFESRLREEALTKAQLPLVRCPVCSYAESTDLYLPSGAFRYTLDNQHPFRTLFRILFTLLLLPLLIIYILLTHLSIFGGILASPSFLLQSSLMRLTNSTLFPTRFRCRSPSCLALTCMTCSQPWRDPHICPASTSTSNVTSLRTHIEAARTAALKRTCPKCNTSFIKDSGCNKLTCVCGYAMCYVCRQGLGEREGGEGYRHFCQHFRLHGGKCEECERCDLYGGDDAEGEAVEVAGKRAEREWRERWGMIKSGSGEIKGGSRKEKAARGEARWTAQRLVDWWVKGVVVCKERSPRCGSDEGEGIE